MVGHLIRKKSSAVDSATPVSELQEDTELDKEAFSEILSKIDQGLRALPATAQVCTARPLPPLASWHNDAELFQDAANLA